MDRDEPTFLRGKVWEASGEPVPGEWQRLTLEAPLPSEVLAGQTSLEELPENASGRPMIGALLELRQALWVPIGKKDQVRGVLLAGTRRKQAALPRELAETVAADLALALELQTEKRLAQERHNDLALGNEMTTALLAGVSADTVLTNLVESCTQADPTGPEAVFAAIGHRPGEDQASSGPSEMDFSWESGDSTWIRALETEPLAKFWRDAVEAGRVIGTEPRLSWSNGEVSRIVAIPLVAAEKTLGVLVAGLRSGAASLALLERLQFRALLAASALARRTRSIAETRRAARRKTLLEASSTPAALLDHRGQLASVNRSFRVLLGEAAGNTSPAAASGETSAYAGRQFAQLFCAREQPRVEAWVRRALSSEPEKSAPVQDPCEAELINGAQVRLSAAFPAGDDLVAVQIEPLPAGEKTPQQSRAEAELQNVLEWVEEGVLLFDTGQQLRAMNTRFAQIAGLAPGEAEQCKGLDELIAQLAPKTAEPEAFAGRWRELARGIEGGIREEFQLSRPVPRVLERSARPVLDATGRRLGRVEIYRDLTAQRVFQAKLLQTEKLAALGQMVTGVAHELSNPLTSILGYSQRLLLRNDLAGRTEEARQIYEEAERASTILRQLLLTARETRPERKLISLNQIVLHAMELQRFGLAADKIRVELDLEPVLPFVSGDPNQLEQVLLNLIVNARQAIEQERRGGNIRLRTARAGENLVLLEVRDDGPGIPQTILARIFDPFFTTKPAGVGTGLGLAIVLSVVREHGGKVNVSSPPAGGAIFSIELPAASAADADSATRSSRSRPEPPVFTESRLALGPGTLKAPAASSGIRAARRGEKCVLVVEDEPTVARLIADVLEDEGLRVEVLLDGREALDRALRRSYDLAICDMKMPGMDGQHFYNSLVRAHSPLQKRFLFVTGDIIAQQTQEFLERNRLPHVAKPFRVEELSEKVHLVLDRNASREERAAAVKRTQ